MTAILFDKEYLRDLTGADAALEADLLKRFESTITRCNERLAEETCDWKAVLHELRGAAAAMGAQQLVELCASAEHNPPASADKPAYIAELKQTAQTTLREMQQQLLAA